MIRPYPYTNHKKKPAAAFKSCDAPDCQGHAEYRAPKSRDDLHDYYWFCLDHVKEYNKAWDYCRGMNPQQIEQFIRTSSVGERPSWPLGYWKVKENLSRDRVYEEYLNEGGRIRGEKKQTKDMTPKEQALRVLALAPTASDYEIRSRYRELVKKYHPDADPTDATRTEKIKKINQAYAILKALMKKNADY